MATDTVLITHVTGQAWMRASDGTMIALHEGMRVPVNAHILTNEGASVTLQANGVPPVIIGQNTDMLVTDDLAAAQPQPADNAVTPPADTVADQVLAALDAGQDPFAILDPTAATLTGGGGGGDSFTRLAGITEATTPLALAYPRLGLETPEFVLLGGAAAGDDAVAVSAPLIPAGPTLNIPDQNDQPEGDGPGVRPGTVSLFENNTYQPQPGGNPAPFAMAVASDAGDHTGAQGHFSFSAAAGLNRLEFSFAPEAGEAPTQVVTAAQLAALALPGAEPIVIDTDLGLLHLTAYHPDTGTIDYTYWSDGAVTHPEDALIFPGTGQQYVLDSIGITVVDNYDPPRTATGQIDAAIVDTAPVAQPDEASVTEDGVTSVEGNVIEGTGAGHEGADTRGADAVSVTGVTHGDTSGADVSGGEGTVIKGTYGDLTLNDDGSYTYKLVTDPADERHADVQKLGEGQKESDVFSYTLTDADGDTSTTTLTIKVTGTNDAPTITFGNDGADASTAVSEEGLPAHPLGHIIGAGNPHGAGLPDDHHAPGSTDTTDDAKSSGHFTVADVDGDPLTVTLGLLNPDPGLTSDGQTVRWSLSPDGQILTGHIGHGFGARDVIKITLTKESDGHYQYDVKLLEPVDHPLQGEDALGLVVPINVYDGHDTTKGELKVSIEDDSPQAAADFSRLLVQGDEGWAGLRGGDVLLNDRFGADGGDSHGHAFAWNSNDASEVNAQGEPVDGGDTLSQYGQLILGPAGIWSFQLDNTSAHTQGLGEGEVKTFTVSYTITDNDGDTSTSTLTVKIEGRNDRPTITFDDTGKAEGNAFVSEEGLGAGLLPLHGNGLPDEQGTPGDHSDSAHTSGSFQVRDADAHDTLTVKLSTAGLPDDLYSGGQKISWALDGDHTLVGSVPNPLDPMGFLHLPRIPVIEVKLSGPDGDGNYSYTVDLLAPVKHPIAGEGAAGEDVLDLKVPVIVTDSSGTATNSTTGYLNVHVEDDSPKAVNVDGGTLIESSEGSIHGTHLEGNVIANLLAGKVFNDVDSAGWGADGPKGGLSSILSGHLVTWGDPAAAADDGGDLLSNYGTLQVNPNGTWSFNLDNSLGATQALAQGETRTFTIDYTLTDSDGDTSTAHLTIKIEGTNDKPTITFGNDGDDAKAVVSEEGLTRDAGNYDNGIKDGPDDAIGNDTLSGDKTDSPTASGTFTVADVDTALSNVSVSLGDGSGVVATRDVGGAVQALTSHGQPLQWESAADGHTLSGYVMIDGVRQDIIEITLVQGATDGQPNGHYTYTVDLKGAIDHPITEGAAEDVLNLNIPITVSDGQGGVTESAITVRVEDDSPQTYDSDVAQASSANIPNVYVGTVDFTTNGTRDGDSDLGMKFTGTGDAEITVSAQGFKSAADVGLEDAKVFQDGNGVGVASTADPYHTLPGEIDYRVLENGTANSETLTVRLPDGKVAYSAQVEFSMFFGGEKESGVVEFWRGGEKVGEQSFSSTDPDGNYVSGLLHTDTFGAFDTLVFKATDNGNGKDNRGDNSDFGIKTITFDGPPPGAVVHAGGDLNFAYGADGAGGLAWAAAAQALYVGADAAHLTQLILTPNEGGTVLTGTYGDAGTVAFQLILTQNGSWEYFGYQTLRGADGKPVETLPFGYIVKDADGDPTPGTVTIGMPVAAPTISVTDSMVTDEALAHGNPDDTNGQYPTPSPYPYPDQASEQTATGSLILGDPDTPVSSLVVSLGANVTASWGYADATQSSGINTGDFSAGNPLQSHGQPVSWALVGGTLVAYTGNDETNESSWVIKVELTKTDGVVTGYEVTQLQPLDHQGHDQEDIIDLKIPVSVFDPTSGKSDTADIIVRIEDDSPILLKGPNDADFDRSTIVDVQNGEGAATGDLGISVGADFENATVAITGKDGASLNGQPVTAHVGDADVQLTSDGTNLVWVAKDDGSVIAVKEGDASQTAVLTITPSLTGGAGDHGSYTVTVQGVIDPLPAAAASESHTQDFTFSGIADGVYNQITLGADGPFTVNLSAADANRPGQTIDPYIAYGKLGVTVHGDGNNFINHDGGSAESLTFTFNPNGGNQITHVEFTTFDLQAGERVSVIVNGDTAHPITIIPSADGASIVIDVKDLPAGMNATEITSVTLSGANNATVYAITGMSVGYETVTSGSSTDTDITLDLGAVVTDGDGDSVNTGIEINLKGLTEQPPTVESSEISANEDTIIGLNWDSFHVANGGDDPAVSITSLPEHGVLQYSTNGTDWFNVKAGDQFKESDLSSGTSLRFVPEPNQSGGVTGDSANDYAQLGYRAVGSDGNPVGDTATLSIDITPVADAPVLHFSLSEPVITEGSKTTLVEFGDKSFSIGPDGNIVDDMPTIDYPNSDQNQGTNTIQGTKYSNIFVVDGDIKEASNGADGKIDGKKGYDVVYFTKDRDQYEIDYPHKNDQWDYKVTDRSTGAYIELKSIEALVFGDGKTIGDDIKTTTHTTDGHATYDVNLSAALSDTDGSEHLTPITIKGLPDGASFVDGDGQLVGTAGAGHTWTFPAGTDLSDLHLTAPTGSGGGAPDLSGLTASVTSVESANSDEATTTVPATIDHYTETVGTSGNDTLPSSGSGADSHDVLIGDPGGMVPGEPVPGGNYNVALLVDLSYSMQENNAGKNGKDIDRLAIAKQALEGFADKLAAHDGELIVTLIGFGSRAATPVTVVLNGDDEAGNLAKLKHAIDNLTVSSVNPGYYTNYEAAFQAAEQWFGKTTGAGVHAKDGYGNLTFFLTDGDPTMTNSPHPGHGSYETETYTHDMKAGIDAYKSLLTHTGTDVYAIGIGAGVSENQLRFFDNTTESGSTTLGSIVMDDSGNPNSGSKTTLTGQVGEVTIVDDSKDDSMQALLNALDKGFQDSTHAGAGADTLYGGNGNDILFGDELNVAWLDWAGKDKPADETLNNLDVLKDYLTQAHDGVAPSNAQVYEFIQANLEKFGASDPSDHNDKLFGGDGDDVLFGQGGNDELHGGAGHDVLYGGSGNDVLHGGAGNDTLIGGDGHDTFVWTLGDQWADGGHGPVTGPIPVDTITDFGKGDTYGIQGDTDKSHQDVLDLSQLLQGEQAHLTVGVDGTVSGDLTQYLHISKDGDNAVINVSSHGTLNAAGNGYDQQIVLEGRADLTTGHDLASPEGQASLINSLIQQGKLNVDHNS
ncbi:retention module-containing protein [Castellaniella hirudinis]|uniref:Retention module-containing protein n=1 Tax=Castellaniella hirudinis TaxID=1144617 RepID=A0ABV8RVY6_9BURK